MHFFHYVLLVQMQQLSRLKSRAKWWLGCHATLATQELHSKINFVFLGFLVCTKKPEASKLNFSCCLLPGKNSKFFWQACRDRHRRTEKSLTINGTTCFLLPYCVLPSCKCTFLSFLFDWLQPKKRHKYSFTQSLKISKNVSAKQNTSNNFRAKDKRNIFVPRSKGVTIFVPNINKKTTELGPW